MIDEIRITMDETTITVFLNGAEVFKAEGRPKQPIEAMAIELLKTTNRPRYCKTLMESVAKLIQRSIDELTQNRRN